MESAVSKSTLPGAERAPNGHARKPFARESSPPVLLPSAAEGVRSVRDRWTRLLRKVRPENPLTVRATVATGRLAALRRILADNAPGGGSTELTGALGGFARIHFARFTLLEEHASETGDSIPASLVFCSDFDGTVAEQIEELAAAPCFDALFRCCAGFPELPEPRGRATFLRQHRIAEATFYANTLGRTVLQIRQEDQLRRSIEQLIDTQDWSHLSDQQVRERIQHFVRGRPELAWALQPAPGFNGPGWERVRKLLERLDIAGALDRIRRLLPSARSNDHEPIDRPLNAHVRFLTHYEDWAPQNPFGAVGFVRSGGLLWYQGLISVIPISLLLPLADWLTYAVFNSGNLAGVRSIHFARWVPIDFVRSPYGFRVPRRALFFSNYDGSQENYMGEFIDTVAWGLNATFSRAVGYPRSFGLVFDGAKNEQAFKHFIRRVQLQTDVWYSAYPQLSAANIASNAKIREGLVGPLDARETRAWLQRF